MQSARIIAGKYKNKKLHISLLPHTRPSKAIIRESLFNTLGNAIYNKSFLEAFGGYGLVGFEALSRGAKEIFFIEKNINTFSILQKNIELFLPSLIPIFAYNEDTFLKLSNIASKIDIFYFDPPFGEAYYKNCFCILNELNLENKIVVFEHDSSFHMPQNIATLNLNKTRKFGRSALSYYL